jgi:hypothetical protein
MYLIRWIVAAQQRKADRLILRSLGPKWRRDPFQIELVQRLSAQ